MSLMSFALIKFSYFYVVLCHVFLSMSLVGYQPYTF